MTPQSTWLIALTAACAIASGCDDDATSGGSDVALEADAADAGNSDGDTGGDELDASDDAGSDGQDVDVDPDAESPPDVFIPFEIESCQDACDRYAACERLVEVFNDEGGCLTACGRASRNEPASEWLECLANEPHCADIHSCEVPPPVLLGCDEVCAAAETCEVDLPFDDCEADCEAREDSNRAAFRGCGETLFDGICNEDAFWVCVADRVYPDCGVLCESVDTCRIEDGGPCRDACIEAQLHGDPLERLRIRQRSECVRGTNNECFRVNQCVDPNAVTGLGHTCEEGCEVLTSCDLPVPIDEATCVGDCEDELTTNPQGHQFLIDCVVEFFGQQQCNIEAIMQCFNLEVPAVDPPCVTLCEAKDVCGLLEGGGCVDACNAALIDPAGEATVRAEIPCGRLENCDELSACLETADPEVICRAHCDRLAACDDPAAGDTCLASCLADFGRTRIADWRDCTEGAADDCEALLECAPAEPPPCDAHCARLDECGLLAQDAQGNPDLIGCLRQCDDDHYADPAGVIDRVACVLTAAECDSEDPFAPVHSVNRCLLAPDDVPAQTDCLNFCRATTICDPEAPDGAEPGAELSACALECGAGFGGARALELAAASDCLVEAGGEADCDTLIACLPDEVEVDCEARCDAPAECGIDEVGCVEACEQEPHLDVAGCVLAAAQRGRGCAAIAQCVGFIPPEPSPACDAICVAQTTCGLEDDAFRCRLECTPAPDGLDIRAACAEFSPCEGLGACLDLPAEPNPDCEGPCGTLASCDGAIETAECEILCSGRTAAPVSPAEYAADAAACVEAVAADACDPEAALACFDVPTQCEAACQLVTDCGAGLGIGDAAACAMLFCPDGITAAGFEQVVDCALTHLGGGQCDNEAHNACALGQPPP